MSHQSALYLSFGAGLASLTSSVTLKSAIAAEESPHGLGKHDSKVY